jgi:LmbE family N-acetylglucosaminyl deacetylase
MLEHLGDSMNKLVIAPHIDDEAIGCGGILDKDTFVYFCGVDESNQEGRPSAYTRLIEARFAADWLEFDYVINFHTEVNQYEVQEIIPWLERTINEETPDKIFIPYWGYNQDHKVVYDACMVALRPHDKNFFVKKVLVYEGIHDMLWPPYSFTPNYFVPIDITRKIAAYECHASQVRSFRSPDMIRNLAALRGSAIGVEYAEAFQILRWVD